MLRNPLLLAALGLTSVVALWGVFDTESLARLAQAQVAQQFRSRAWFIMLMTSLLVVTVLALAFSRFGTIRLGRDDERPEFSTLSWLTMLFAAGMGVGLLFYGAAEPLTHYQLVRARTESDLAASYALVTTIFNWGLHAWSIYAITALVIAYFSYRKGRPGLVSSPIRYTFRRGRWVGPLAWVADLLAIYAIAIGLAGSLAIGVFQVEGGLGHLFGITGDWVRYLVFGLLCLAFLAPLTLDLGRGMARLSNLAMAIALGLMVYLLLVGPTHYLMNGVVDTLGAYLSGVVQQGFATYPFFGKAFQDWFHGWTLNYMVWWIAWAPFVGVFVARISRGRTIREFVLGVVLVPTLFSLLWFGVFGGTGFYALLREGLPLLEVVRERPEDTTFFVLEALPLTGLTGSASMVAAFLFLVTSVVSAAYVLAMFSTSGEEDPPVRVKLAWGVLLALLGLAMLLADDVATVRAIIALGAMAFVFILPLLVVALLKTLIREERR
ncbi:BCCT family transporter [Marichromatium gracile]|uniref:BCCT family transporter n=1 Tax=Marichromatium gracile TaxID=1048 RepID=UPI001F28B037|nr:BCCT family transporter [Marichromatium gracile]MCF1182564.1 BCCT family transporter [Marichromatium gracile]